MKENSMKAEQSLEATANKSMMELRRLQDEMVSRLNVNAVDDDLDSLFHVHAEDIK